MGAFRDALSDVVALPSYMNRSLADLANSMAVHLKEEALKPNCDTALVGLLCDCARVIDEHIEALRIEDGGRQPRVRVSATPTPLGAVKYALSRHMLDGDDGEDLEVWGTTFIVDLSLCGYRVVREEK